MDFLNGIDGDVPRPGNGAGLSLKGFTANLEHFVNKEGSSVASCFRTHQRATPVDPFTGKNSRFPTVGDALVLAKHITDFTTTNTDVPGRNVCMLADVAIELSHEALAKTHDLIVRFPLGIEIRAPFAATDGHAGQSILEDLLETKKLDNAQINGRMKPQAALVGT